MPIFHLVMNSTFDNFAMVEVSVSEDESFTHRQTSCCCVVKVGKVELLKTALRQIKLIDHFVHKSLF